MSPDDGGSDGSGQGGGFDCFVVTECEELESLAGTQVNQLGDQQLKGSDAFRSGDVQRNFTIDLLELSRIGVDWVLLEIVVDVQTWYFGEIGSSMVIVNLAALVTKRG